MGWSLWQQRRQVGVGHDERGYGDADRHQGSELAKARQATEIQEQKRSARGNGGPKDARCGNFADIAR